MLNARTRCNVLVSAALAVGLLGCAPEAKNADLVIRGATLVIGDGRTLEGGTVVVHDGRIVAVGNDVGAWKGTIEIAPDNASILPGLIDSHVHLMALASGSADSVARFRREKLPGILSSYLDLGVTTVRSTGDPWPAIREVRDELHAGMLPGPRVLTSGPLLTAIDGHPATTLCTRLSEQNPEWCRENLVRELPNPGAARDAVRELAENGVDFIKVVYESEAGAELDNDILDAIVAEAGARHLQVVAHASPARLAAAALEAGVHGLVHVPFHAPELQTVAESLGKYPISATAGLYRPYRTLEGHLRTPYLPWSDEMEATRQGILSRVAMLWKNGSPLAFGTDTPMFEPHRSWRHEIDALLTAGLTPADVLIMATRNAAIALGIDDELGTLEKGKRADLVIVKGNPNIDIDALQEVVLVVKNGEVVVDRL